MPEKYIPQWPKTPFSTNRAIRTAKRSSTYRPRIAASCCYAKNSASASSKPRSAAGLASLGQSA